MRLRRVVISLVLLLIVLPLLFSIVPDSSQIAQAAPANTQTTYGSLNFSEVGLPVGSLWGFVLRSELNPSLNYGMNATTFATYLNLSNIPNDEYFVYSLYTDNQTNTTFKELAGYININQTVNRIHLQFYRVEVKTDGVQANASLIMIDQEQVQQPLGHNVAIYMPNGSYASKVGAKGYYSKGGMDFNVNGQNITTYVNFTKCYNITLNFKLENSRFMSLMRPLPFDYILSYSGIKYSYDGIYQTNTTLSMLMPNGTYNVTLSQPSGYYYTVQSGKAFYGLEFSMVSSNYTLINVSGASQNITLEISEKVLPLNNTAYFYYYDLEYIIPLLIVLEILGGYIFWKRKKK